MVVHKNRVYIPTFPEHAKYLIENSTHEVWVVYVNTGKKKEKLDKDNYIRICNEIQKGYDEQIMTHQLYLVHTLPDLTIEHYGDSVRINSSFDYHKRYYNWD